MVSPWFIPAPKIALLRPVARSESNVSTLDQRPTEAATCKKGEAKTLNYEDSTRVKVTGYRLLSTSVILAFGVFKATLSLRGEPVTPTTLEIILGLLCAVGIYWAGHYENIRPHAYTWFFHEEHFGFGALFFLLVTSVAMPIWGGMRAEESKESRLIFGLACMEAAGVCLWAFVIRTLWLQRPSLTIPQTSHSSKRSRPFWGWRNLTRKKTSTGAGDDTKNKRESTHCGRRVISLLSGCRSSPFGRCQLCPYDPSPITSLQYKLDRQMSPV